MGRTTQLLTETSSADEYGPPRANTESGDPPATAIPGSGNFLSCGARRRTCGGEELGIRGERGK
jgi:hypothetical protein